MTNRLVSVKDITLVGLFTALIIISTYIIIPTPFVPITLQVAVILLGGVVMGSKLACISAILYMLLGLIGFPVFAGGSGGIMSILRPTFGYIIGFIFAAFTVGYLLDSVFKTRSFKHILLASLIGVVIISLFGIIYYYIIMNYYLGEAVSISYIFINMFIFTLPVDILKSVFVASVGNRLKILK